VSLVDFVLHSSWCTSTGSVFLSSAHFRYISGCWGDDLLPTLMEWHSLKSFNVFYLSKNIYVLLKMNFHAVVLSYVILLLLVFYKLFESQRHHTLQMGFECHDGCISANHQRCGCAILTWHKRLRWSGGSVLPLSTQVRGFKPGRSRQNFSGRKNPQHAFLRSGSKAIGPMSQICGM